MSFSRELKDFAAGYRSGVQLYNQSADSAARRAQTERYDPAKHGGDDPFSGTPTPAIETSKPGTDTTTTESTGGMPNAGGKSIGQQMYSYFRQKGLSHAAAAGITGNLMQESGGDQRVIGGHRRGDNGASGFAAQWQGKRLQNLIKFAGSEQPTLQQQLDFVLEEMNPNSPYRDDMAAKVGSAILGAQDVATATKLFRDNFERPSADDLGSRLKYANSFADSGGNAGSTFSYSSTPAVDTGAGDADAEDNFTGDGDGSDDEGDGEQETSYAQPPENMAYPGWVDEPAIQVASLTGEEEDPTQKARKGGLIKKFAPGGAVDPWSSTRGYTQPLANQSGYKPYDPGKSTIQPRKVGTPAPDAMAAGPTPSQIAFRNRPKPVAPVAAAAPAPVDNNAALRNLYAQRGALNNQKLANSGSQNVGMQRSMARRYDTQISDLDRQIMALRGYEEGGAIPGFAPGGKVSGQRYQQKIKPGPGSQFRSARQEEAGYVEAYNGDDKLFTKAKPKPVKAKPKGGGKKAEPAKATDKPAEPEVPHVRHPPNPTVGTGGNPTPPQPKPGRLSDENAAAPAIPLEGPGSGTPTEMHEPGYYPGSGTPTSGYDPGRKPGSGTPTEMHEPGYYPAKEGTPGGRYDPTKPTIPEGGRPSDDSIPAIILDLIEKYADAKPQQGPPQPAGPDPDAQGVWLNGQFIPFNVEAKPGGSPMPVPPAMLETNRGGGSWEPTWGFAGGGAIPDDPLVSQRAESANYQTAPAPRQARQAPQQQVATAEPEEQHEDVQPTPTLMGMVRQAVSGGLSFLKEHFGAGSGGAMPTQSQGPANNDAARRMAGGEGAATSEEIQQIDDAVDPQRRYSEGDRQLVRLAKATNWYLDQGRTKDAQASAASLLQAGSLKFSRLGTYAQAAYDNYLQTGDPKELQNTVKILQTAYGLIPDGAKVDVTQDPETGNLQVTRTDENGNEELVDVTPEQLPGLIQKTMDSSMYWQRIFSLADPAGSRQKAGWEHADQVAARKREEGMQDWATKEEYRAQNESTRNTRENEEESSRHARGVTEEAAKNEREKKEAAKVEADKKAGKVTEWKTLNPLVRKLAAAKKAKDALGEDVDVEDPEYIAAQDEVDKAASAVFDALPPEVDRWERMKSMGFYPEDFTYVGGGGDASPDAGGGETPYKGDSPPPSAPNARPKKDGTWWIDNGDGTYSPVLE